MNIGKIMELEYFETAGIAVISSVVLFPLRSRRSRRLLL